MVDVVVGPVSLRLDPETGEPLTKLACVAAIDLARSIEIKGGGLMPFGRDALSPQHLAISPRNFSGCNLNRQHDYLEEPK